jgi:ubiquinol-cytochrome c reductase iron-sulfur subunit
MSEKHELSTVETEPIADPGLPEHEPRPTDVDEAAEKRAERQVAMLFGLSAVFTLLFFVSFFVFKIGFEPSEKLGFGLSTPALGGSLGLALLLIGVGIIQWARKLMGDHELVEFRHPGGSSQEDRDATVAILGLAPIVALRDLGPLPGDRLYHTIWKKGMRVVQDVDGSPIRPVDMEIGQLVNGEPAIFFAENSQGEPEIEGVRLQQEKAKAAVIIVKMDPGDIKPKKGRENWGVNGILCFSKICTHVGCPISLWEQLTHHLLCPCHQSTFDLADNGRVIFGPAARALPQLPLAVDAEGYLIATSDFTEPVGPSFWERG